MKKIINVALSLILCLAMLTATAYAPEAVMADDGTVTVTVNYVYESNNGMVSQPYYASIPTGSEFKKDVAAPKLINYSVPLDKAEGLNNDTITYSEDINGNGSVSFNLDSVTSNITVTLYYVAGAAQYTVRHYLQNLENDEYSFSRQVNLTGDIDAYTQAVADNVIGFVCAGVPEYIIAADGSTVVDIYYNRTYYTVIFDVNGGVNGPSPIYAKYGATFDIADITAPTRAGYNFTGWSPEISGVVSITQDITYVAQWQAISDHADYTIVIWGENPNDTGYSYISSHGAWGNVGSTVTWTPTLLVCKNYYAEDHVHTASCYGATTRATPSNAELQYFRNNLGGLQSGYIYRANCNATNGGYDNYYLYLNGTWYQAAASLVSGTAVSTYSRNHGYMPRHTDYYYKYNAVDCGKHIHSDECYMSSLAMDSGLWDYEKSDEITIDADGSAVMNVYFTRKKYTITFRRNSSNVVYTITEKWGANISSHWPIKGTNGVTYDDGQRWDPSGSEIYEQVLVFIEIMPAESFTLTVDEANHDTYYMHYMVEALPGSSGTTNYNGRYFIEAIEVVANYNYVTEAEDFFALEGYTKWMSNPTFGNNGQIDINNGGHVYFYYTRNSYNLTFYSASNHAPDKTETVQYQNPLTTYDYTPTSKPNTVEAEAIFAGWYLNPECTGDPFDFTANIMPSNDIALYAKWVNGYFTVETYTDESLGTYYVYDGYTGIQSNVEKYTLASAPNNPAKQGEAFVGWFYKDANSNEQPFSFTMPITRDYKLYPKFSNQVMITYVVHYYLEGTTTKIADDRENSALIGSTVTEKAKLGLELNLVSNPNNYFPQSVSTSVVLGEQSQEIIFYYREGATVNYTVKYVDATGKDLLTPKVKSTQYSVVTEMYEQIENYSARQYQITQELSTDETQNVIIFVYDPTHTELTIKKEGAQDIDVNQTFIFTVQGNDANTSHISLTVTIHGNSQITITDLPLGNYTVTEKNDWSWRYEPTQASQVKLLTNNAADNIVTFTNTRDKTQWLDGDSYKVNLFTGEGGQS